MTALQNLEMRIFLLGELRRQWRGSEEVGNLIDQLLTVETMEFMRLYLEPKFCARYMKALVEFNAVQDELEKL